MSRGRAVQLLFWHYRAERWNDFQIKLGKIVWPAYPEPQP